VMIRRLVRCRSPARWRRFLEGHVELIRRRQADDALDEVWRRIGPLDVNRDGATVIADGLWMNPGYFLRLRLFLGAVADRQSFRLLGLLRDPSDRRQRRALERIGFSEFVHINVDQNFPVGRFHEQARALIADARTHADLLRLRLPHDLPAYVWYDTVLKKTCQAQ